ncbi:MAG: hypothetical protein KDB04_16995 [Acidimicrobiales bacterium]|nr:hypothetical protein [Acidimicrobiales bacterium]
MRGPRSEPPPLELRRLVRALARHDVTYLIVGGANAFVQGADHATTDLDVLPIVEPDNLRRLGAAMTDLNARLRVGRMSDEEASLLPVQLADGGVFRTAQITNWRTDAGDLDVMLTMPDRQGRRRPYEHYAARAVDGIAEGQPVRLAHLADVIASKEHADRPKDQAALPALRLLLRQQERDRPV